MNDRRRIPPGSNGHYGGELVAQRDKTILSEIQLLGRHLLQFARLISRPPGFTQKSGDHRPLLVE